MGLFDFEGALIGASTTWLYLIKVIILELVSVDDKPLGFLSLEVVYLKHVQLLRAFEFSTSILASKLQIFVGSLEKSINPCLQHPFESLALRSQIQKLWEFERDYSFHVPLL